MLSRIINPVNNLMKHSAAMPSLNAQAVQYRFSADGEESDSDFKKQTKVELTNENAQKIIEKWVTENNVVLFMKGTPLNPQCGYSNFVVEVLKKYGTV
jgi:DNA gyrase/topoisomerase IV subunit B